LFFNKSEIRDLTLVFSTNLRLLIGKRWRRCCYWLWLTGTCRTRSG